MKNEHNHAGCGGDHHIGCGCHHPIVDILTKDDSFLSNDGTNKSEEEDLRRLRVHVFYGGTIRTVEGGDGTKTAEAMAVWANEIIAIGDLDEVRSLAQAKVEANGNLINYIEHDLEGRTLVPGLIEPHAHVIPSALMLEWDKDSPVVFRDYSPYGHQDDKKDTDQSLYPNYAMDPWLREKIKKDLKEIDDWKGPNGDASFDSTPYWLLGNGLDTALLRGSHEGEKTLLDCIDREYLDGLQAKEGDDFENQRPILIISASLHTAYTNTAGLYKTWAVNEDNPEFRSMYKSREEYVDKTNGVLQELINIEPALFAVYGEQIEQLKNAVPENMELFAEQAKSRGVTLMYEAGMKPGWWSHVEQIFKNIDIRIGVSMLTSTIADFEEKVKGKVAYQRPQNEEEINCYVGSCKVISDGSSQGLTAYQSNQYACPPPDNNGIFNYGDEDGELTELVEKVPVSFKELVEAVSGDGWPMLIHANGDQAVKFTLDAYENAGATADDGLRHRIEHCSLLNAEAIQRMKKMGINPSFLIGHVGYWGHIFDTYIFRGQNIGDKLDLCKSSREAGIKISLHSDCTVSPVGPLRCMEQAFTRKMEGFNVANESVEPYEVIPTLNDAERLTAAEALSVITYQSAYHCQVEHLVGSLEVGKLADFVILDQDPLNMSGDNSNQEAERKAAYLKMRYIGVNEVWIGGKNKTVRTASKKTQSMNA